jgi:MFS family permease
MHTSATGGDFLVKPREYRVGTLTYTLGGLVILFFWLLLGDFALAMRERSVGPVVQLMLKKYETSNTVMSVLLYFLPPMIGMFLSPIISFKSDRHRGAWGRRIPFLLIPTPIAALAMVGLAFCPGLGEWLHETLGTRSPGVSNCVLIFFSIFWTAFEFAVIAGTAVLGALINDVVPRQFLGRFYGLFRAVSLIAGMIFNYALLGWAKTHFFEIFLGIGVVFGVGFSLMCLKVKEGSYPPPDDGATDHRAKGFGHAVNIYFRECFSSRHYLWIFVAMLLATLTFAPFNNFSILYAETVKMDTTWYGHLIAYSYLISLALAYPLGWLVDKFHALRVSIVALCIYAVSTAYGVFFVRDADTLAVALVAHTVLSGTYFTASASLGQALFPKLKFAQFASAAGVASSIGSIVLAAVLGPVLDLSGSNYRLTWLFGLILCGSAIMSLLVVYRKFMNLGGPGGYVAPEPVTAPRGFEVISNS